MIINNKLSKLIKKGNIIKSNHKKKNYYNLYKNPFIDLTDDEEDSKSKRFKNNKENNIKKQIFTFKVIPIYQEGFYNLFSREIIFHKYKIFTQEINGLYTNKRMKELFENLFKNYNNLYNKKLIKKNASYDKINKNRINTMPLFDNNNNESNIDLINQSNKTRIKYSSFEKILNSLKNDVLMQRKKINNKINNKEFFPKLNKNIINKKPYLRDTINFDNYKYISKNLSPINLRKNKNFNSLNLNEEKKEKNNEFILFHNYKIHKQLKNFNNDNKTKIKALKINKKFLNKDESFKKRYLFGRNKQSSDGNILFKYYIRNKNKTLLKESNKVKNKNSSYDFDINKDNNRDIEFLINKYSQNLLKKLTIAKNQKHNSSN